MAGVDRVATNAGTIPREVLKVSRENNVNLAPNVDASGWRAKLDQLLAGDRSADALATVANTEASQSKL